MVKNFLNHGKQLFERQQNSILSAATIITLASFLSAILGFVRERILVSYFFNTPALQQQLDAYRIAARFPELAFQLLVIGALSAAFIPVFTKYYKKDPKEAFVISSTVMNLILLIFSLVSLVIFIFAPQFNRLITSVNFSFDQINLATNLTRIMLVAQLFFVVSNFLTGILQARQRFLIPALSPLAHNLGIITGIVLLSPYLGIYSAAIGVVFGAFLHLVFQLPLARKMGFRFSFKIYPKHPGVKEMLRLVPPRTLAISINQLEIISMSFFATALSAGTLTILELAQRLMSAPIRVFSVPIGQASLPFLSQEADDQNRQRFKATIISSLHKILFLALPASALLLILRIPLVRILYGSREFPWSATLLTGKAVAILSLSIFAQSAHHILSRAFYALENTKTPFIAATAAVIINIVLSAFFVFGLNLGIIGVTLGMSISSIIHMFILLISLHQAVGGFPLPALYRPFFKMGLVTFFTGIFLWVPMRLLDQFVFDTTRALPLVLLTIIASLIGMVVYIFLSKLFGITELQDFRRLLTRLGNWQKVLRQSDEVIETPSQAQEIKPL